MKRCRIDRTVSLCRQSVLIAALVLLPAAARGGPIFLPGRLDDGKFVADKDARQPCYSVRYSTITANVSKGVATTKLQ